MPQLVPPGRFTVILERLDSLFRSSCPTLWPRFLAGKIRRRILMTLWSPLQYNPARRAAFLGVAPQFASGAREDTGAAWISDAAAGARLGGPGSYSEKSSAPH